MDGGEAWQIALVLVPVLLLMGFLGWMMQTEVDALPARSSVRHRPWIVRQLLRRDPAADATAALITLGVAAVWALLGTAPLVLWVLGGFVLLRAAFRHAKHRGRPSH